MMADWTNIFFKAFWCGWAAVGFGILFNVPVKTLFAIWIGGAIAGSVKFSLLFLLTNSPVIQSSFLAALAAGFFSTAIGFSRHEPPKIFAIPSVIPLVPGVFAYNTMMGLIKLTEKVGTNYSVILTETVHNGVTTLFIIMVIALGVTIPIHLMRKNATKKFQRKK